MELEQFAKFPMVDKSTIEATIEFAKLKLAMEKEQIIDAFEQGHTAVITSEQYYNQTFTDQPEQ